MDMSERIERIRTDCLWPSFEQEGSDPIGRTLLDHAIYIAAGAHNGQIDKGGAPYIHHVLRVMRAMRTDEERMTAVLHDVLEDCPDWSPCRLLDEGVPVSVVKAVLALTRGEDEGYQAFIQRVALNPLAAAVKRADLRDNMDLSRIALPGRRDHLRVEKYQRALDALSSEAEASGAELLGDADPLDFDKLREKVARIIMWASARAVGTPSMRVDQVREVALNQFDHILADFSRLHLARANAPQGWRDIATAPKDGTRIDLWASWRGGGARKTDMCWTTLNYHPGLPGWTDDFYGNGRLYDERQFTHWVPVPAPPTEAEGLSGGALGRRDGLHKTPPKSNPEPTP